MLEYRAEQDHPTISGVLAKELDGIASTHAPELSAAIPGFAAAFTWPVHAFGLRMNAILECAGNTFTGTDEHVHA